MTNRYPPGMSRADLIAVGEIEPDEMDVDEREEMLMEQADRIIAERKEARGEE